MKMDNNYLLIENNKISYFFDTRELQFVKYSNGVLYIKLKCSNEVDQIGLDKNKADKILKLIKENLKD